MNEEISEVKELVKYGDADDGVMDVAPQTISLENIYNNSASPSERSNAYGVTNIDTLMRKINALPMPHQSSELPTIFRVPIFREGIKKMVMPQIVSIGPYHHGEKSLCTGEKYKLFYLRDLLARNPDIGVEVYREEMRKMEKQARQCYQDAIEMSSDDFVLMLLLDGCFILEHSLKEVNKEAGYLTGIGFGNFGIELLLVENQIPYSVIHKLGTIYFGTEDHNCEGNCPIRTLLCETMRYAYLFRSTQIPCRKIDHLLHLYQLCITPPKIEIKQLPFYEKNNPSLLFTNYASCLPAYLGLWDRLGIGATSTGESYVGIPSATKLGEAGINFKRKHDPRDIFDVTFENGIIEIPYLTISSGRNILFTNILFYEQANLNRIPPTMTSYLILMGYLVDTSDDVAILGRSGILENYMPNDEEVTVFFSQINEYLKINIKEMNYNNLLKEVNNYINKPWNRNRAILARNYLSNPNHPDLHFYTLLSHYFINHFGGDSRFYLCDYRVFDK